LIHPHLIHFTQVSMLLVQSKLFLVWVNLILLTSYSILAQSKCFMLWTNVHSCLKLSFYTVQSNLFLVCAKVDFVHDFHIHVDSSGWTTNYFSSTLFNFNSWIRSWGWIHPSSSTTCAAFYISTVRVVFIRPPIFLIQPDFKRILNIAVWD